MFFSISTQPDHRFWHRQQHLGLWINYDQGWQTQDHALVKGYSSNSCRIQLEADGVTVLHSQPRSFPLWFEHGFITNLFPDSGKRAWAQDGLHMMPDGRIVWTPWDLDLSVPDTHITISAAQEKICARLDQETADLGDQPVKLYCTGGLDTALIRALLTAHDKNFEQISYEHFEVTPFVRHNRPALEHYWSYGPQQLHHWSQPTWLATGGCGDEYFLRGPAVIAMLTAWYDINFGELLEHNPACYHYHHFQRYRELWQRTWQQRHQLRQQYPTRAELNLQVMDNLANDHQHWHLEHTVTWTPLKNIEIARILLQLSIQDLVPQFLSGQITRDIIAHYDSDVLPAVSAYKNYRAEIHA